ncbi:uncharacterized protein LOC108631961 [Ceratina calcarata]|uniref:Large ribosomal subunit protein bL27m n=1 Tax=Ceratina calcarata TaxID=156304 RepID=A0AAJ7JFN5_9HYME|nr:uncharacterized protein LOC108631961 [Ceratina calcarata]XP_017891712.1 uncharacterized protein LOC108631961 [Ceratina calcarata]XP_026675094.1 uncharacterized protein LOC108631961 [Ceratina calcarata]
MAYNILSHVSSGTFSKFLVNNACTSNLVCVRYASKKASSSTRNKPDNRRPKHRGCQVHDGHYVQDSTMLVKQLNLRFHPGLYVGIGRNCTLYAMEPGKVVITCEKINPNMKLWWCRVNYGGRENSVIYKKHFNVIPNPQDNKFILVDTV